MKLHVTATVELETINSNRVNDWFRMTTSISIIPNKIPFISVPISGNVSFGIIVIWVFIERIIVSSEAE